MDNSVLLRFAFPDDALALARLAALDSAPLLASPVLLAEIGGQLRAALSLADGGVIADPFHPTTDLVDLLRARARQLDGPGRNSPRWLRRGQPGASARASKPSTAMP